MLILTIIGNGFPEITSTDQCNYRYLVLLLNRGDFNGKLPSQGAASSVAHVSVATTASAPPHVPDESATIAFVAASR